MSPESNKVHKCVKVVEWSSCFVPLCDSYILKEKLNLTNKKKCVLRL